MRTIDADHLYELVQNSLHDNPHDNGILRIAYNVEHRHFLKMIENAPTVQRYEPPAKPLTWEELALRKDDVVYLEDFGVAEILVALLPEITPEYACFRDAMRFFYAEKNDMNTRWRAWLRKPTDEERRAAAWIN